MRCPIPPSLMKAAPMQERSPANLKEVLEVVSAVCAGFDVASKYMYMLRRKFIVYIQETNHSLALLTLELDR